jgi:nitric-oxide synthase
VEAATAKICRERKGRDVFVVGAANVGKSAFVRAMLREMSRMEGSNFDAAAMANSRCGDFFTCGGFGMRAGAPGGG